MHAVLVDRPDHRILLRRFVSRYAAIKARDVLEGVGLRSSTIEACFQNNPLNVEEAVQAGLIMWTHGYGFPCTWEVLIDAMEYADIAQQHIVDLRAKLCLP